MAAFRESLVVSILGDSAPLQRELQSAEQRLGDFQARLSRLGDLSAGVRLAGEGLSAQLRPLLGVSELLAQIGRQIEQISRTPLTLQVAPALAALGAVSQMLQAIAAQARVVGAVVGAAAGGAARGGLAAAGAVRLGGRAGDSGAAFARGGLVTGPGGIDQVWARLTAGEFVLSPESTAVLGPELLGLMNSEPHRFARLRDERRERRREAIAFVAEPAVREDVRGTAGTEPAAAGDEIHYHGGITVQVQRPTELGPVLRELESRGVQLRVRRG